MKKKTSNKISHTFSSIFEVNDYNNINIFRKFYLYFGILFILFSGINYFLKLPIFFSCIKLIIAFAILSYHFLDKKQNIVKDILIMAAIFIDIYLYAIFTFHFYITGMLWFLLAPNYILLFKKDRINKIFLVLFILLFLLTPILNNIIINKFNIITPEIIWINILNIITLILVFVLNYIFILKHKEIHLNDLLTVNNKNTELEVVKVNLLESYKYKENFFAMISHEIRTPLNAIIGISNILKKNDNIEPKINESLKNSSELLVSLINDFLEYNKIKEGKVEIKQTHFNLYKLIYKLHSIFDFQLKEKNLFFEIIINPDVPKYLFGDPKRLMQILLNLIGNGIIFTSKGKVSVQVKKMYEEGNNVVLVFIIKDTGMGLSKDQIETLFDPNKQKFSTSKFSHNIHSSLGLNITKRIIDAKHGEISVFSEVGKGSTFNVKLEFEKASKSDLQAKITKTVKLIKPNLKILLIDDNKINLTIAKKQLLLKDKNLNIITGENGLEAIKQANKQKFDVILIDIRMPVMSGVTASEIIKKESQYNKDTLIIALTADVTEKTFKECKEVGINEIICKPFIIEDLIEKINQKL